MLKISEVMKRTKFIHEGNKMILKFDLSNLETKEQVSSVVKHFITIVGKMPKKSMVALVDFTDLSVEDGMEKDLIELTNFCNPNFKASAIIAKNVGTRGLANQIIDHFGRLNMEIFGEESQAVEWLKTK